MCIYFVTYSLKMALKRLTPPPPSPCHTRFEIKLAQHFVHDMNSNKRSEHPRGTRLGRVGTWGCIRCG